MERNAKSSQEKDEKKQKKEKKVKKEKKTKKTPTEGNESKSKKEKHSDRSDKKEKDSLFSRKDVKKKDKESKELTPPVLHFADRKPSFVEGGFDSTYPLDKEAQKKLYGRERAMSEPEQKTKTKHSKEEESQDIWDHLKTLIYNEGREDSYIAKKLKELFKSNPSLKKDINKPAANYFMRTPIFLVAGQGLKESCNVLIENGADIKFTDSNFWTPLHSAAKKGRSDVALFLIEKGACVNAKAQFGLTPLHVAAIHGQSEVARVLIEKGAELNGSQKTPLHEACWFGNPHIVNLLLEKGASISAKTKSLKTPLHHAAAKGQRGVVEILLNKGASTSDKDIDGFTPLHYAIRCNEPAVVKLLLEHGTDPRVTFKNGSTALHSVAYRGTREIAELLIAKGADVHARDSKLWTPLHAAAYEGNREVAELLIEKGADIEAKDYKGRTPAEFASAEYKRDFSKRAESKDYIAHINQGRSEVLSLLNSSSELKKSAPTSKPLATSEEAVSPTTTIEKYTQKIEKNPRDSLAYVYRAAALKSKGHTEKAIQDYSAAIALNEAEPDYYNNRGVAYVDANQLHLARNDLETAINIDPNHSIAHANLGHILWDNGDFDGAYDHFMNSVKIQYPNFKAAPAEKLDPSPVVREGEHVTRQQGTNKYKILSIDGGGVRGLIPAMIVHELEAKVHQPIAKMFDFVSGTSSGGVLALCLVKPDKNLPDRPQYSAHRLLELYNEPRHLHGLFKGFATTSMKQLFVSKYSRQGVDKISEEYLGDCRVADVLTDNFLSPSYEINRHVSWCFTKTRGKLRPEHNFYLRDIARATSAAPTYFDPAIVEDQYVFLDGGIFANNPTLCAYLEAQQTVDKRDMFMVSLGTGQFTPDAKEIKKSGNYWMTNLFRFVSLATSNNTHNYMQMLFPPDSQQYFRFDTKLERSIGLDNVDEVLNGTLGDIASKLIEDLYASDTNSLNKVIEILSSKFF